MGRCLECGNTTSFSFMCDVRKQPVYRCDSIGVQSEMILDGRRVVSHTLDHQDRFYMDGKRVIPVRIGQAWVASPTKGV